MIYMLVVRYIFNCTVLSGIWSFNGGQYDYHDGPLDGDGSADPVDDALHYGAWHNERTPTLTDSGELYRRLCGY